MSKEQTTSGGISLAGLVFVLFLGLKLTGFIDWSWWWVTSPLWLGPAIILGVFGIIALVGLIASLFK